MASIDVEGPIMAHLRTAERRFDAAMDALVPPTPELRAARDYPAAVVMARLAHAFQEAAEGFARAFSGELNRLRAGGES